MDRAPDFGSVGSGFDSWLGHLNTDTNLYLSPYMGIKRSPANGDLFYYSYFTVTQKSASLMLLWINGRLSFSQLLQIITYIYQKFLEIMV
jgi:hypothetical protein